MIELLSAQVSQQLAASPKSPKYRCLRDAIIDLIVSGQLPEGTRLPTEQTLAQHLPVSLGTIQKALRDLVESGDLYRQRRKGTFVAGGDHRHEIGKPAFGFVRPDGSAVKMVFIRLLARERIEREGPWTERLGACEPGYAHLVRLDNIDGAFDCHTEIYLRHDFAGDLLALTDEALEHESLVPLMQAQGLITRWSADNRITQTRLPKAVQRQLGADTPVNGLRLETHYQTPDGQVFAWQIMHIPDNDYSLTLTTTSL